MAVDLPLHHPLRPLLARGWVVELTAPGGALPLSLRRRYPHLPAQVASFLAEIETCHNQRDDAWIFGSSFFTREDPTDFRWNECELMSLDAVEGDVAATHQIREYWDHHLPFMMAVHSDYEYLAVQTSAALPLGRVVHGCAPEFEVSTVVAPSFERFLTGLHEAALSAAPPYPFSVFL
jgi:hypothetical protein